MSKYLDFIGEKVTKKENKEGYLILGATLGAVFLAKHFIHKKSSSMYFLENLKGKEDIDEFVQELGYPNDFREDILLDGIPVDNNSSLDKQPPVDEACAISWM